MPIQIIIFGQLKDITGSNNLQLTGISDTDELVIELNKKYPALVNASYIIAVDKEVILKNTVLTKNSTIALMPPFAGG